MCAVNCVFKLEEIETSLACCFNSITHTQKKNLGKKNLLKDCLRNSLILSLGFSFCYFSLFFFL